MSDTGDAAMTNGEHYGFSPFAITKEEDNGNGNNDLIVLAYGSSGTVYIFYNDGSWGTAACTPDCLAADADETIEGQPFRGGTFGASAAIGDFVGYSKADLAVGAYGYTSNLGRVYIFENDGSLRHFGMGYSKRSIIPAWLFAIILAIFSYFSVLYYSSNNIYF